MIYVSSERARGSAGAARAAHQPPRRAARRPRLGGRDPALASSSAPRGTRASGGRGVREEIELRKTNDRGPAPASRAAAFPLTIYSDYGLAHTHFTCLCRPIFDKWGVCPGTCAHTPAHKATGALTIDLVERATRTAVEQMCAARESWALALMA